ncbi:immunoglobulin-binding protein 1 [Entomortierella parvispora]|uniref:Immunoglobulin-binding protein 1 n=1 Tax=Entomortierella parvispora TaxID=205924 RepID=A0A9P3H141_9FUNG|nr:immunoglobulin-binding protein 1 [Entomortierella parvispora]
MAANDADSLSQVFQKAEALYLDLQNATAPSNSDEFQGKVNQSIKGFQRSADMVRQLSLFSENEFMEDISTKDLRFLLTEYYLGELFLKIVSPDRLADITKSKDHFDHFLLQCETHDILTPQDKKYHEQLTTNAPKDAATRRGEKIARFKREKEMKTQIEEFHKVLGTTNSGYEGELSSEMEDQYRDFVLLHLQFAIFQTMEQLIGIQQEIPMLKQMQERRNAEGSNDARSSNRSNADARDGKVDDSRIWNATGPLMDPKGRPLRPFVITNKKAEMMKGVFRPGHSLPTMSIEEYLDQEIERGNFLSGGTEEPKKKEADDNDDAAIDAETLKARNWDDFKDDNPKGWGNKGGRHG